jgi:hypothetical protein
MAMLLTRLHLTHPEIEWKLLEELLEQRGKSNISSFLLSEWVKLDLPKVTNLLLSGERRQIYIAQEMFQELRIISESTNSKPSSIIRRFITEPHLCRLRSPNFSAAPDQI